MSITTTRNGNAGSNKSGNQSDDERNIGGDCTTINEAGPTSCGECENNRIGGLWIDLGEDEYTLRGRDPLAIHMEVEWYFQYEREGRWPAPA